MKKLQNLGTALSKQEQKRIVGGDDYGGGDQCCSALCCDGSHLTVCGPGGQYLAAHRLCGGCARSINCYGA